MNLQLLLLEARQLLEQNGIENAANEARWILQETAKLSSCDLLSDRELPPGAVDAVRERLRRRAAREPLQYVLGSAPFRMLDLAVTPAVLIPRPETEDLVQWAVEQLPRNGSVLDLGTGSGAIALVMASERQDAHVTASDVSCDALAVARGNARNLHLPVSFREGFLWEPFAGERFDLVLANLPYVRSDELPGLEPEVRDHEPRLALVAGERGLALIRQTIETLADHLTPGGAALFEMSPDQVDPALKLLQAHGFRTESRGDRYGKVRFAGGFLR